MIKKLNILFLTILLLTALTNYAQQVPVGQWRDHLPYNEAIKVVPAGNKIYCITSAGMIYFNKSDNTVAKLSKINGLSDAGITCGEYSQTYNIFVVGYSNGNVDIIENNVIYNLPEIKNKSLQISKQINSIVIVDKIAYLACGFGIVAIDIIRREVKDTYFIGPGGDYLMVNDISTDGTTLYAATEKGIYSGGLANQFLVNYNEWKILTDITTGTNYSWLKNKEFNKITVFNNKIYANMTIGVDKKDTIYEYSNGEWKRFLSSKKLFYILKSSGGYLFVADEWNYIDFYSQSGSLAGHMEGYGFAPPLARDIYAESSGQLWIADSYSGLVKRIPTGECSSISPNGPNSIGAFSMCNAAGKMWIANGGVNESYGSSNKTAEIYKLENDIWTTINYSNNSSMSNYRDITRVKVNPANNNQVFASTWGYGVLEFNGNQLKNVFNEKNSTLASFYPNATYIRIAGMEFDSYGNLFVANTGVSDQYAVRAADGKWYALSFADLNKEWDKGDMIITKNNHKWNILPRGKGMFVFDEKRTFDNKSDDKSKFFNITDEDGQIISNDVFSVAEDQNGVVWVGTAKGVVAYYSPEKVFSSDFYGQQVKVPNEIPGQANYLLETETVTAIAIDGSNRKWFGTEGSGIYLMSEDCITQIHHFTSENSPLPSNNIVSLGINGETGELFIGTDRGLISYRGTATTGKEEYDNVLVFPNPVKPDYEGLISIKGLLTNSNVKITDVAGNIVFETKSEGGQANWDGKNFNGNRVSTGVYLIFLSNDDGSKTNVTKLLFLN